MLFALSVVAVMYFFLIPARYEGTRYAPSVIERYVVIGISLGLVAYLVCASATLDWFTVFGAIVAMYVCCIPLRLLLRFKVPRFEQGFVFVVLASGFGYALILPMLSYR